MQMTGNIISFISMRNVVLSSGEQLAVVATDEIASPDELVDIGEDEHGQIKEETRAQNNQTTAWMLLRYSHLSRPSPDRC